MYCKMDKETVIRVENISKAYRLYDKPVDRLKESVHPLRKKYHRDFYALRDVSFEVKRGETVGIVGRNGSGKSTLLKIITGVLTPSGGKVTVGGKVSALLELGTGFNPELTGIENVYFSGTIMGYTREEIDAKLDRILSFADIGDFVHQPVKTYSSGMFVRLAFALAINVEPEILIVDEALAVGDEVFQRKCFSRIKDIQNKGGTVLFVSHSAGTVVEFCNRALLFDRGELLMAGRPKESLSRYHKLLYAPPEKVESLREEIRAFGEASKVFSSAGDGKKKEGPDERNDFYDPDLVPKSTIFYESRGAIIKNPRILTLEGRQVNLLSRGGEYIYTYDVIFSDDAYSVRFGMMIKNLRGVELGGMVSHDAGDGMEHVEKRNVRRPRFRFRCIFLPDVYFLNAGVLGMIDGVEVYLHRCMDTAMFRVQPEKELLLTGTADISSATNTTVEIEKMQDIS